MSPRLVVFRLHPKGVLLLGCLAVLLAGLSFAAGWLLALGPRLERAASSPAGSGTPAAAGEATAAGGAAAPPGAAPAPATTAASPGAGAPAAASLLPPTVFSVQLESFAFEESAAAFAESLAQQGFEPVVLADPAPDGRHLYRVAVGRYATREEATAAAAALADELDRRAVVVEARPPKPPPAG